MNVDTELKYLHKQIRKHAPSLEAEDYRQISKNGADAGWNGFIYYNDTCKFFDNNEEPIMNYYYGVCEDYGYKNVFDMFAKNTDATTMDEFRNWATWGILEAVAREFYDSGQ